MIYTLVKTNSNILLSFGLNPVEFVINSFPDERFVRFEIFERFERFEIFERFERFVRPN